MMAGRVGEVVVAAGRPGLEAAATWGLETISTSLLLGNMSIALRRAGEVGRAAELIDPVPLGDLPTYEDAAVQGERASLDMLRGRCPEAVARYDALAALPVGVLANRIDLAEQGAPIDLWCGRPRAALDRLVAVLTESMATEAAAETGGVLALAMRAAADVADSVRISQRGRIELLATLRGLHEEAMVDHVRAIRRVLDPARACGGLGSRERTTGRPTHGRAVGGGGPTLGPARPAARLGVLQVARRADRAFGRSRHHRGATVAPRRPGGPRARAPVRGHCRNRPPGARRFGP